MLVEILGPHKNDHKFCDRKIDRNRQICDRKIKGNTRPLSLTNLLCNGYMRSVLLHLKATDTSQVIWEQGLAALDLQKYSSRNICHDVPFQKVLQSFPLTFHSLYWTTFVFIAPFAFPAMLSVTCVEYGFCTLAKQFCCLAEASLAAEFASLHSNGHVWLMGPLSGASCIFRVAPLSPA